MNANQDNILGISGTIGAGKGTAVSYFVTKHKFTHFSVRGFLLEKIRKEGLSTTRDVMRVVANKLRKDNSPSYIIECLYKQAQEQGGHAIIESVRTVGEADFLKSHNVRILAIDADKQIRYKRIRSRGLSTDHISFEEFSSQENAEMSNTDIHQQNILGVMKKSDFLIYNDGNRDDFFAQLARFYTNYYLLHQ